MKYYLFAIIATVFLPALASAASLSGYAWSETIGWIHFAGPGYQVEINDDGNFTGYAWSEHIGWIRFDANNDDPFQWARACGGADRVDCKGLEIDGWDGFIHLAGDDYSVAKDETGCNLTGWAWGSDVLGWVHFAGSGYGVRVAGCGEAPADEELPQDVIPVACDFSANPTTVALGGQTQLVWDCNGSADSCSITSSPTTNININNGPGTSAAPLASGPLRSTTRFILQCANNTRGKFSTSVQVTVIRPIYCEIIPFLGTCKR